MRSNKASFVFLILFFYIKKIQSQDRVLVDVQSDIPNDGTWSVDCDDGYADLSSDFNCGPDNGGSISIPPDKLNGEKGFWTVCAPYGCRLRYQVQPGDTLFKARLYQSSVETEVSFDGISWDYIPGEGWIEFEKELGVAGRNGVNLRFSHFSSNMFNILDKIVINGDFEPPTIPTTEVTTEVTTDLPSTDLQTESSTEDAISTPPTTTSPECPTTPSPEPCNCCDRCPERTREIHHHHYYPYSTKFTNYN